MLVLVQFFILFFKRWQAKYKQDILPGENLDFFCHGFFWFATKMLAVVPKAIRSISLMMNTLLFCKTHFFFYPLWNYCVVLADVSCHDFVLLSQHFMGPKMYVFGMRRKMLLALKHDFFWFSTVCSCLFCRIKIVYWMSVVEPL